MRLSSFAAIALLIVTPSYSAQNTAKKAAMTEQQATGTFEVKLTPQTDGTADVNRMTIDKIFHGDLEATSVGQMIAVRTAVDGPAGYVAMERVTGTLQGRSGSFALQHSGTMNKGAPSLHVGVVPDSGTDRLTGISGSMMIIVDKGKHRYVLDYSLVGQDAA